jgi:O-acetyl-ADP-ribose deacetylase (regulator of RNase III)
MPERFNGRISIVEGDITEQHVDAIVNAANETLLGGGGVDGAIHRVAGPALLEECRTLYGCRSGEAKITGGYSLPARFVIHTVGPVWRGGKQGEDELLASCYRQSLALAESCGVKTIAFPAISTGAYGFPFARATVIAVKTVLDYLSRSPIITKVVFVCHEERAFHLYNDAVREFAPENTGGVGPEGLTTKETEKEPAEVSAGVREQVRAQLQTIEAVYGIRIVNRERLIDDIVHHARDRTTASFITAALNSWVAVNGISRETEIPGDVLGRILSRTSHSG